MDYAQLRKEMVDQQLIPRGIKNKAALDAFLKVERHLFVPEEALENAYDDFPVPIGAGQTISQPYIVALMTECLELKPEDKVLEIGTGSGYQTAILALLCKEVYSVERLSSLAKRSEALLKGLGYSNINIKEGDGTLGWPEASPFDRIIVTAAAPKLPEPLFEQLREGGRIILPLGESFSQTLSIVEKTNGRPVIAGVCACVFVPLIGKYGWEN